MSNRYGGRSVGDSPMKGSAGSGQAGGSSDLIKASPAAPPQLDRLANDFSKLSGPGGVSAGGGRSSSAAVNPYMVANSRWVDPQP